MHVLELGAGFDPQFLDELLARGVVGSQGLTLPARAGQGEDLLDPVSLAQRVRDDERPGQRDDLIVVAEAKEGLGLVLLGCRLEFVQPGRLGGEERLVHDVLQRLASP